jgi:hypothetical protein
MSKISLSAEPTEINMDAILIRIRVLNQNGPIPLAAFSYHNSQVLKCHIQTLLDELPAHLESFAIAGPIHDCCIMLRFKSGQTLYPHVALHLLTSLLTNRGFLKYSSIHWFDAGDLAWRAANRGIGFEKEHFDSEAFRDEFAALLRNVPAPLSDSKA